MDALESFRIEGALAAQAEKAAAEDEVGQNDFLTMLVAQLENQDPLNPQDSANFAAQLAQFSSVEQLIAMRTGIDRLVSASSEATTQGAVTGTSNLDPTNLVGKQVTVFGSQVEVDERSSRIGLDFRTADEAAQATVTLLDANGNVVLERNLVEPHAEGELPSSLRPGDHVLEIDPAEANLPPGVYAVEFTAQDQLGEDVTVLPMIRGLVTGAILAGDPAIRMGNRIFSLDEVLEVSLTGNFPASGGGYGPQPQSNGSSG
ncbi:MAG: hypothetical protein CL931_15710 [Deltaproteobacteria bacterium]|nr:hypothetical protein [Deltaproteobacteria bacterium]